MSWRGVNLFAVLAALLAFGSLGLASVAWILGTWQGMAAAGVGALASVTCAVLAVLEDVI